MNPFCFTDEPTAPREQRDEARPFLAEGREGLVVGLTGERAVAAVIETLKQGGSAADAAIATAMTQVVEVAGSYISFAGILTMTYFEAATGTVRVLDAGFKTPREEKDPLSIPGLDDEGLKGVASGRTALVPGFMAGVGAAHERFGKLPLATVIQPAIALAEEGFPVDPLLAASIALRKDVLSRLPETKGVFTQPNAAFVAEGDLFRQPELAATLKAVAAQGVAFMYKGQWAKQFVDMVRREGGQITAHDLEAYQAVWEEPLETTYRDARVFTAGQSSTGGVDTIEALNLLELAALGRFGSPACSPESVFWLMQITNNQFLTFGHEAARQRFPDHDFSAQARVTKEHARWLWEKMQAGA